MIKLFNRYYIEQNGNSGTIRSRKNGEHDGKEIMLDENFHIEFDSLVARSKDNNEVQTIDLGK